MLQTFVESVDIFLKGTPDGILSLRMCKEFETVCLGSGKEPKYFFYFYSCLISDIHVRFPLDSFIIDILRVLNVTPT